MKKAFSLASATFLFCAVMQLAISIYTLVYGIEKPYDQYPLLYAIDLVVEILSTVSILVFIFIIASCVKDWVSRYEKPEHRILMFHSRAEISWVEVEYDSEGEEIRRQKHGFELVHNMARNEDDKTLSYVVEAWHNWRRANDKRDANTVQDFCDYVNTQTVFKAAPTKEEFINLLLQKK